MIATFVAALLSAVLCISLAFAPGAHAQVSTVDLLTDFHLRMDGGAAQELAGWSVGKAGDVNGDGLSDLVVGGPGKAYVLFGPVAPGTVDLGAFGQDGFRIDGAGESVAGAGDVNGDALSDLVVGAPGTGRGGRAYVVFGKASTTPVNVTALGNGGFLVDGPPGATTPFGTCPGDQIGDSVDAVGDMNGDGLDDVLVAGPGPLGPSPCITAGAAFVVFGKSSSTTVDLAALAQGGIRMLPSGGTSELSAAGAGDVNGDGRPDVVIGSPQGFIDGQFAGGGWVVFGRASSGTVSLGAPGFGGFALLGPENTASGRAVAGAGDVNGDGLADVAVGAPEASANGRDFSGSAFVVFGRSSESTVDLSDLGGGGFRIDGARGGDPGFLGDTAGSSVAAAGDVNRDGRRDLLVGARTAGNSGRPFSGSAYVVFGRVPTADVDLAALGAGGIRIDGASGGEPGVTTGDEAGFSVAGPGDVTGDGRPDILVGAPRTDHNGRTDSGSAYLVAPGAVALATGPADAAPNVPADSNVFAVFSEAMDRGSTAAAFTLRDDTAGRQVEGSVVWFGETVPIFVPEPGLEPGRAYTASIASSAEAADGTPLAGRIRWSFSVAPNPVVSFVHPTAGAGGVYPNQPVVAVFSQPMNQAETQRAFSLTGPDGQPVAGSFSWYGPRALVFTPASDLRPGATYTASVSVEARDEAGNPLAAATSWSFTTTVQPVLEALWPQPNATGVPTSTAVVAAFSAPMDQRATAAALSLRRTHTGQRVAGSVVWYGPRAAVFLPSTPLSTSTSYTAAVGPGARGEDGNQLANPTSWMFTTGGGAGAQPAVGLSAPPATGRTSIARPSARHRAGRALPPAVRLPRAVARGRIPRPLSRSLRKLERRLRHAQARDVLAPSPGPRR